MTEAHRIKYSQQSDPRWTTLHLRRIGTHSRLPPRLSRFVKIVSLLPLMTACYSHHAYDPRQQAEPVPYQGEVRVLTVRGEVFMLRSAAVHGDTLIGDRTFCKSGFGYDKDWCRGVRRFPADSARIAIPVADISEALTRSLSTGRTVPLAVFLATGMALAILLTIYVTAN